MLSTPCDDDDDRLLIKSMMEVMEAEQLLSCIQPTLPDHLLHSLHTLPDTVSRYLWLRWLILIVSQEMTVDRPGGGLSEYTLMGRAIPSAVVKTCLNHSLIPTALLAMARWICEEHGQEEDADLSMITALKISVLDVALLIETVMKAESNAASQGFNALPTSILLKLQRWESHLVAWGVWQEEEIFQLYQLDSSAVSNTAAPRTRTRRRSLSVPPTPRTPPPPVSSRAKSSPLKALESMTSVESASELSGGRLRLQVFLRKYLRLAATLLDRVCQGLSLPHKCRDLGWKLLLRGMEGEIDLFRQRHLLQILIMIVYSVGKLCDHALTFTQIITAMRSESLLQMAGERLYRRIPLKQRDHVDIVHLYNHEFLPRMRNRIYSLNEEEEQQQPMPSSISPSQPPMPLTPTSLVTISPSPLKDRLSNHHSCEITNTSTKTSSSKTPSKIIHLTQDLSMPTVREEPEQGEQQEVRKVARRLFFE